MKDTIKIKSDGTRDDSQINHIKMALMANGGMSDTGFEDHEHAIHHKTSLSGYSEIQKSHRRVEYLLESGLMKAGVDIDKLEEIYAHNQTVLRRILKEQEDEAIKRSSRFRDTFRHKIEGRRKTLKHLVEFGTPNVTAYELLDKPFLIWQTQGIKFPETHLKNWRKIN